MLAQGFLEEARAAFRDEVIEDERRLGRALARLAATYLFEGRMAEARVPLERAVSLDPGRAEYWDQLGGIYEWAEDFPSAIRCWNRVLELAPDDRARPHVGLGWALQQTGRIEEAVAQFRAGAKVEPGAIEPTLSLGLLEMERGRFREAEAAFRATLAIEPGCPMALYWLANLLGASLPETELDAIKARLDEPRTTHDHRTRLLFALGHVHDARGEAGLAAPMFRRANALHLERTRAGRPFAAAGHEHFVAGLIRAFDGRFLGRMVGAGLDSRRPVFIVGLPRSGTTLVEQILAGHSSVHAAGELLLGIRTFESLPAALGRLDPPASCVASLDPATLCRLAEAYLRELESLAPVHASRIVDKLPENYYYLGLLTALFPQATVISCRRDPRDVALSCYIADFRNVPWASDPDHIGVVFRAHQEIMAHWRSVLRTPIHEVQYEDLVAEPETQARRLVACLGLDWDPGCLEFHKAPRVVNTGSRMQVRQPVHRRSVGRWKAYERELPELFAGLPTPLDRASSPPVKRGFAARPPWSFPSRQKGK